jgi:uncharacterized membrane protein (DUF106 family)
MILIKNAFQLIIYQYNIFLDFFYHYHIKIFKNHLKTYQFNIFFYKKYLEKNKIYSRLGVCLGL